MNIQYSKPAVKALNRMDKSTQQRLRNGIEGLLEIPPKGDIKAIQGSEGQFRLRVGSYRIIYRILAETISIEVVKPRGDAYK